MIFTYTCYLYLMVFYPHRRINATPPLIDLMGSHPMLREQSPEKILSVPNWNLDDIYEEWGDSDMPNRSEGDLKQDLDLDHIFDYTGEIHLQTCHFLFILVGVCLQRWN